MKNKIILGSVLLSILLLFNINTAFAFVPLCKSAGNKCDTNFDCCPVYLTENGVFYGVCADVYAESYKVCTPVSGLGWYPYQIDWCENMLYYNGSVYDQLMYDFYTTEFYDYLSWNISELEQYSAYVNHACELLFQEQVPSPVDNSFHYKYNLQGNLISITTPKGEQGRNYYDLQNRLYATENMDSGTTKFFYDGLGNLIKNIDSKQQKIYTEYDSYYRTKRVYSPDDPTVEVIYYYGDTDASECPDAGFANNRVCKVVDYSGYTEYKYDARGRVEKKIKHVKDTGGSFKTYTIEYEYDSADNLFNIKYGDTDITYYRNDLNQIDQIAFTKGIDYYYEPIVNYTYNPTGTIKTKTMGLYTIDPGNLLFTDYSYNLRDWLTSIYVSKGSSYNQDSEIFKRTHDYDPAGNVISISNYINFGSPGSTPANLGSVFIYDPMNRLESEDHDSSIINPPITLNYLYDIVGNREWLDKSTGESQDYIYYNNRLVKIE